MAFFQDNSIIKMIVVIRPLRIYDLFVFMARLFRSPHISSSTTELPGRRVMLSFLSLCSFNSSLSIAARWIILKPSKETVVPKTPELVSIFEGHMRFADYCTHIIIQLGKSDWITFMFKVFSYFWTKCGNTISMEDCSQNPFPAKLKMLCRISRNLFDKC